MKYLDKQLKAKKQKVVWLASYPKSGNTWFRCFLSVLFTGDVDFENCKLFTDGIFSSRKIFDELSNIDSRLLRDDDLYNMLPAIYRYKIKQEKKLSFVKVHDAYLYNSKKEPIFPSDITHKVIYLVRNPLDVIGSYAHHNAEDIATTVVRITNEKEYLGPQKDGFNHSSQFRQLMYDWKGHVNSWTTQKNVDVCIIRYEDMLSKGFESFKRALEFVEIYASDTAIKRAIKATNFSKLKSREEKDGFGEKNIKAENFFRSGKANQYKKELTKSQIEYVIKTQKPMMKKLGYL